MGDLARLLLRSLLPACAGIAAVLLAAGAAHAHGSQAAEGVRSPVHHVDRDAAETTARPDAPLAGSCVAEAVTSSGQAWEPPPAGGTDPFENGRLDPLSDLGCCGVACHAAVGNCSPILRETSGAKSIDPLAAPSALHGRAVNPGDRPPRSA